MHRIVPELIIENYRAGRYRGDFRAASMFLDISGFSSMTDALMGQGRDGAETLAAMMREVFDPLVEAIFGQGGIIIGYAGDSISALFPIETSEQEAALRALAAAHAIQQGLAAKPLFQTQYGMFHISAKIGLAIGAVSWGILGSGAAGKALYYFRGDAVDEAAAAEHEASAGDILLTRALCRWLGSSIETQPVEELRGLRRVRGNLPGGRPVVLPPVDVMTASAFTPRELITQDVQGEFRQTVLLFMHMPDLPEDQLQQLVDCCFELQSRYGGLIDRIDFGDKGCTLVVLWGAPAARENDIDRALGFILDLQRRVEFPIKAGVTYYVSYAGYVGGQLHETYTAYGWGANLAARFMVEAADKEIWLDERIFQRVEQRFQLDFVGEQSFKGFAQKQKVYTLRGRKQGAAEFFRGKLAGRERELQALTDFADPLWAQKHAGVLGIWGEAGIGKSRLVHEFKRLLAAPGRSALWAPCQCDEILQRSFSPFRYWLAKYFAVLPADEAAVRSQKFLSKLDDLIAFTGKSSLARELKRRRRFLAALADVEWPESAYEQVDAQARYDNMILALIALIKAESLRQPVILFVEDAQYLDEDSKAFLPRLKRALTADSVPYPVAIVMAARWQATKVPLEDGLVDREIELTALTEGPVASICEEFLGGPAAARLVALVNERAEGNPFFVEQSLRYLREQGLLEVNAAGEWSLKHAGGAALLPGDVSAMLVARLDQLPLPVREVVQAASVLGRAFDVPVLSRMLADASELENKITVAEQAAVWSSLGETRYIFNHALLRDVAYNMQLQSRRRQLHARALNALRAQPGAESPRHYGELAYHGEQAALAGDALRYLVLAGDAAREEYQNTQALDYYRRALAFVPAADLLKQYDLRREREKLLAEQADIEEQSREIEALLGLADTIGEAGHAAEARLLLAGLANCKGEYERSAALAEQARDLALSAGATGVALGAYRSLVDAYFQRGMYREAVEQGEAGIVRAREAHALHEEAALLNLLGLAYLEMKNPSAARAYFEQSLAQFRAADEVRGVARVLANFGLVAGYQAQYAVALDYFHQALQLARETGSRKGEGLLLGNMGWISGLLGDYQKARAYTEHNLQIARELGDQLTQTFSLINLSSHAGALGECASALDYAGQALELATRAGDRNLQAWALTYLGHGQFESGNAQAALQAYRQALHIRQELEQPALATEPAAGLARICLQQNDMPSAQIHTDAILAQLEQDGTLEGTDQPLRVYLSCYLVLTALNDPRASAILNTAHDMLKTRANGILEPATRQAFLENVSYNREILSLWEKRHKGAVPT